VQSSKHDIACEKRHPQTAFGVQLISEAGQQHFRVPIVVILKMFPTHTLFLEKMFADDVVC
jgi:hypothetical protein